MWGNTLSHKRSQWNRKPWKPSFIERCNLPHPIPHCFNYYWLSYLWALLCVAHRPSVWHHPDVPWTLHWCSGTTSRNRCSAATCISATCCRGHVHIGIPCYASQVSLTWHEMVLRESGHPVACCRSHTEPSDALGCDLDAGQLIVVIGTRIDTYVLQILTCMYFRLSHITAW